MAKTIPPELVTLQFTKPTKTNIYGVDPIKWRGWKPHERFIFNYMYSTMLNNQDLFKHPKTKTIPGAQWATTCFNAAWTATDAVVDSRKHERVRA